MDSLALPQCLSPDFVARTEDIRAPRTSAISKIRGVMDRRLVLLLTIISACTWIAYTEENDTEDLYKLLDIPRDANVKEIRKAFKKLAVKLHPDKNPDDKEADTKFAKLARAYEVLKDPDTRKRYDLFGDIDERKGNKEYQSYTYYRDQFGIYDDDPVIVTLTLADFEMNVVDNSQIWFVNFYSAHCHHCHELAPTWRKLASELEGVIRIAAVNCVEDWPLCRTLAINSYPTLLFYEKDAKMYEGIRYEGERTLEKLEEFVISHLTAQVERISPEAWDHEGLRKRRWLLFLCADDSGLCPEPETRRKLAAIFEGLIPVGMITNPALCDRIYEKHRQNPIVFWKVEEAADKKDESVTTAEVHSIEASDAKEITEKVLKLLPDPQLLTEESFRDARTQLRLGSDIPWLICFYVGAATELNLQLKHLPMWLPHINLGLVHCGRSASLCSSLHVSHYPAWGVLKAGGAFELHQGRDILHEIVAFARDSSKSTNLHALSPAEFYNIVKQGSTWFIDWYAPWCPPCRKLIPELRKASQHFTPESVQFGTIDCTLHSNLCSYEGIRAYPTTRLYNGSQIHHFHGVPNEQGIVEFVEYMLHPIVINLDESSFAHLVRKPKEELWIVDFYAPWCGPCQRLTPQWHALAKQVSHLEFVKVAQVDCHTNGELCSAQNVQNYPTIRMYPLGSKGLNTVAMYNGHFDTVSIKRWLLSFVPSPIKRLTQEDFKIEILTPHDNYSPWLIDFYAPWCGHCTTFEPEFLTVAQKVERKVRSGKVDCERDHAFCIEQRVRSYPTVILFLSPTERHEITTQVASKIVNEVNRLLARRRAHDEL